MNSGMWAPTALSNGIRFSETVNAVYGMLSGTVGRAELQGGLLPSVSFTRADNVCERTHLEITMGKAY